MQLAPLCLCISFFMTMLEIGVKSSLWRREPSLPLRVTVYVLCKFLRNLSVSFFLFFFLFSLLFKMQNMSSVILHYVKRITAERKKKLECRHCQSVNMPALSHLGSSLTSLLICLIISPPVYQTCSIYFFNFSPPAEYFHSLSV